MCPFVGARSQFCTSRDSVSFRPLSDYPPLQTLMNVGREVLKCDEIIFHFLHNVDALKIEH